MDNKRSILEKLTNLFSKQEGLDDLLVMSKHWDGHKRENAVRRLGLLGNPIALPALMIRANDWVLQVRVAAKNAILNLRTDENVGAFITCLPELYHLQKCGRDNHDYLIEQIEGYLLFKEHRNSVITEISNSNPLVQRACFKLALENELMKVDTLVILGLEQSDIVTRTRASHLLRDITTDNRVKALNLALKDSFMPIRREALQIKIKEGIEDEVLLSYLFDNNAPIREVAIKHLKASGKDVFNMYLSSLTSDSAKQIKCSLWGIGYLGKADDTEYVDQYLNNEFPSIRKQAISTKAGLLGEQSVGELENGLCDESSAVCKEAARLIQKFKIRFDANKLLDIVCASNHIHTANSCIGLAKNINKWERAIFLLELLNCKSQKDEEAQAKIEHALMEWDFAFNRSQIIPNDKQIAKLANLMPTIEKVFEGRGMKGLMLSLKTFGIVEK
jgi:HEAT repeat protein